MSTNTLLVNLSHRLGYHNKKGVCHGIALRWLEAFFLDEENRFERRIKKIIKEHKALPQTIQNLKECVKKRGKQKEDKSDEEELFDILAFFDSLELYHLPSKHKTFFNKPYEMTQEKIRPISLIAGSEKIRAQGGLFTLCSEPVCYKAKELKSYLDDLSLIFNDIPPRTVGILLTTHNHAISLAYTPGVGWKLMDVNDIKLPKIAQSFTSNQTDLLAEAIIKGLNARFHHLHSTFNVSFISTGTHNQNLPHLKKKLASFKKRHVITEEMANRDKDYDNFFKPRVESGDALIPWIEEFRTSFAMIAARNNHAPMISMLAKHKAQLNQVDKAGITPAMAAATHGYDAVLKALAEHGVNLNEKHKGSGFTIAHTAAQNGHLRVLELLCKLKIALDTKNDRMQTPVHIAAYRNRPAIVRFLAQQGLDLNAIDKQGFTPAMLAAQEGKGEVIAVLGKHKARLNDAGSLGRTPLFIAALNGHNKTVKALIRYGAQLNKAALDGNTPACIAAQMGHTEIIRTLGKHHANLYQANHEGTTPAIFAVKNGHIGVLQALADYGVDLNWPNPNGLTPAEAAVFYGRSEVIPTLNALKVDLKICDSNGSNLVFLAAQCGHAQTIETLEQYHVDIDKPNIGGNIPAHIAAQNGNLDVILVLKKLGADFDVPNHAGNTPYDLAVQNKHWAVANALEDFNFGRPNGCICS